MSNTDFDPGPPVDFTSRRAQALVANSVDDEPDKAARAQTLATSIGVDPGVVHENLPQYEAQAKNQLSAQIVGGNRHLQDYINSHPLAAKVSNDDYGQLDSVSQAVGKYTGVSAPGVGDVPTEPNSILSAGIKAFQGTTDFGALGEERQKLADQLAANPVFANIFVRQAAVAGVTTAAAGLETALGLINAGAAMIGETAHQSGIDKLAQAAVGLLPGTDSEEAQSRMTPEKLTRDLITAAQVGLSGQAGLHGIVAPEVHAMVQEAAKVAKAVGPYVEAGKEPPVGIHPAIDEFKVEQAKTDADNLSEALKESVKSATRDRSPDLFTRYVEGITDGNIGISADAVRGLYGDKVPAPDDGLLGFVPDIAAQLERAEATGGDIQVPLAQWLGKVEPEVAKALKDHIRARPDGVTVEEGKELPSFEAYHGSPHDFEAFDTGKTGTGAGQAYGFGHYFAEDPEIAKGYSKDLAQVAAAVKGEISGDDIGEGNLYRARILRHPDEFLDWDKPLKDQPSKIQEALRPHLGDRDYFSQMTGSEAYEALAKPDLSRSRESISKLLNEAGIPGVKYSQLAREEEAPSSHNYVVFSDKDIQTIEKNGEAVRTLRQAAGLESVRAKRKLTLRQQAGDTRYNKQTSEAIAVDKAHGFDLIDEQGNDLGSLIVAEERGGKRLFVDDIKVDGGANAVGLRAMRDAMEQLAEQFPNAETLEGMRVSGAREKANKENVKAGIDLNKVRERAAARKATADSISEPAEKEAFSKASAIGMTVDQYKRYQALIEKRAGEDAKASEARAMADQRRTQTAEWKANRAELRPQVKAEVESRPEVELDEMLRGGKVKLSPEGLTDDQRSLLPKDYLSPDGIHLDDLGGLFGDQSGRGLVDRVIQLNQGRDAAGMKPVGHLQRMVDAETDRQMEAKYGSLDRNILEEAKDQVLSETQEDLLHEETLARASEAGLEFSIDKERYKAALKDFFDRQLTRDVSSDTALAESGRAGRATEMALLKGDYAEAFRQKQRQYNAIVMANYAKKFEKAQARFEKLADRYKARELPSVDQEYTNWIRDILLRTGKLDPRQAQDLSMLIDHAESGIKGLAEFVDYKEHHDLREVPVSEYLQDPNFRKKYEDLTAADAQELHDSVRTLDKNGRDEKKYLRQGEAFDLQELKDKLIESLQRFKEKEYDTEGNRAQVGSGVRGAIRTAITAHLQVETVFNRLDRFDAKGPWNQFVFRPLVEAANHEALLEKEFSKKLGAIADNANLKEVIPTSIFKSPFSGETMRMTRKNLRAVLLNAGNDGNLFKMTAGYKIGEVGENGKFKSDTAAVKGWLDQYATKEDWDWGQKMWDLLKELGQRSDTMYRGLTGVAPAKIEIKGIDTPHGRYEGGYYPLIRHELYGEDIKLAKTDLEGAGYIRATTAAGYTKKRTGAVYPLSLDLDALPNQIRQIIHDTSYRPAVIEAGKIFYDNKIKNEFKKHLGAEYSDMFVPWLKDVANTQNYYASKATKWFIGVSDFMRQNAVTTLVGLNPSTVLKHTPTALMSSMAEVGPKNFLKAASSLLTVNDETGNSNWQFAMKTSEELQRRARNWEETMGGGMHILQGEQGTFMHLRDVITQLASKPVAMGDLISAVPTWMAKYTAEMEDHGVHGDAVYAADKSVRQAHGSSAITSKSQVARARSLSWFTGFFTFFNDLFNRQVETVWKAGEALDLVKEGRHDEAMKLSTEVAGRLFAYVIAPAMIEELVTPLSNDQHESWAKKAAKGLTFTLSSSYVFVREMVNGMLNGRDPAAGLLTTSYKSLTDMARDLTAVKPKPGNVIKHSAMLAGMLTGMVPAQVGRTAEFVAGKEKPKGPWGWLVGARYGTLQGHSQTFDQWMKGR